MAMLMTQPNVKIGLLCAEDTKSNATSEMRKLEGDTMPISVEEYRVLNPNETYKAVVSQLIAKRHSSQSRKVYGRAIVLVSSLQGYLSSKIAINYSIDAVVSRTVEWKQMHLIVEQNSSGSPLYAWRLPVVGIDFDEYDSNKKTICLPSPGLLLKS
eukprot:scaffold2784_cov109-Cylindrotheca_fusiformis.AAC.4